MVLQQQSYKELKAKIDSEGSVSEEAVRKAESKLEDERKAAAEAKKKVRRPQLRKLTGEQFRLPRLSNQIAAFVDICVTIVQFRCLGHFCTGAD